MIGRPDVPRFTAGRGEVGHLLGFKPQAQPLDAAHVPIPGSQIPAQAPRREVVTSPHFASGMLPGDDMGPSAADGFAVASQIRSTSTEPTEYPAPKEQIRPVSPGTKSLEYFEKAIIEPADDVFA